MGRTFLTRMKLQYQIRTDKKRMVYTHQINAVCSSRDTKLYHYCIIGIHNFELLIVMYKMLMSLKTRLPVVLLNAKQFALFFVQRINIDLNERTDNCILIRLQTFFFLNLLLFLFTQINLKKNFVNVTKVRVWSNFYFIYQYGARYKNKSISVR